MDRAERLLDLVTLFLNAERPVSFREIREHFADYGAVAPDAAARKFERDKAELLDLGIPVEWVDPDPVGLDEPPEGGYRIRPDAYFLPRLELAPDELALLYVAGAAAHGMQGFPWPTEVARALEKIAFAAEESGARPGLLARRLSVQAGPRGDAARAGGTFGLLRDALARQKRVRLTYRGLYRDRATEREVDPYALFLREGVWCLYAHCHLRGDRRTFYLDRIESLTVNPSKPRSPDYALPDDVDAGALARMRPWEYPIEPPQQVALRLEPHLAFSAAALFGERAAVVPEAEGRARVEVPCRHVDALLDHVLTLGDGVEILAPEPVRARLGERVAAAVAAHGEAP